MADCSAPLMQSLIRKVKEYPRFSNGEIEKFVGWQYMNISMVYTFEYDIRDIDEELYLKLLQELNQIFNSNNIDICFYNY